MLIEARVWERVWERLWDAASFECWGSPLSPPPPPLIALFQAVWQYEGLHGHPPAVGNAEAAEEVVRLAHNINAVYKGVQAHCGTTFATAVDEIDADVIRKYALYYAAELQVCCSLR